jgi:hypothetical protein
MNLLAVLAVGLGILGAFVVGRATVRDSAPVTAQRTFVLRVGDTASVPAASTRCLVTQEGGAASTVCSHFPRPSYSVVFFKNDLFVYKNGNPDKPVFSAHGRP